VLNCLFSEVFRPCNLSNPEASGEQSDGADDDWEDLMAGMWERTSRKLAVMLHTDLVQSPPPFLSRSPSKRVAYASPCPRRTSTRPIASASSGIVSDEQERAVREALEAVKEKGSLVELVRSLDWALRRS
jgi:hypothetical protein